ncbi:MAG TPA: type I restriction-modification enzyme R subunit C-terminal domain-containing protein [Methanofastidiosum sp.]|nr:type I restriction-modification enzyme R subunit C-terminal domain-containing protein [Methanofastidiosum sp.]HNU60976.1 type I restriction-modification enzyme R subunit C-terminal domain-containing protein [Methanofastidiosum sp.]HOI77786.1 type I restriction-modification enzyme R subunit C-terminal domain-containing protein [Methanofastidiosum sp.]
MNNEARAREEIDKMLSECGWIVQDYKMMDLGASRGVAVREFPLLTGIADYLLFIDRKACGVLEAKRVGIPLGGVADQSIRYVGGLPDDIPSYGNPLPFVYASTGKETSFVDLRDPKSRSRRIFSFHRPESLKDFLSDEKTLRRKLQEMPPLITEGLRDCQIEAVTNLEKSFKDTRPRALIQMATGSGKTFTAISFVYRLIKHSNAKRVLFLVDRTNLGKQAMTEFSKYKTPDDGRKFTELYNVQHLSSNVIDPASRVCISTIQRVYSMLRGEIEMESEAEEQSLFDQDIDGAPVDVCYNPFIPIETFDFIITDECHRSIYNLWRQVLEYFDAFIIGLTATPSKQTLGFFNQNLVMEYNHERAVADGVNVGYDVYRINTAITEKGSTVEAGFYIDKRDRVTRQVRWESLDEELKYEGRDLDRSVVAPDQIRTVVKTFKERLFTDIFPGRKKVPKTLIFAKDDSHAEDIVNIIREEFGQGDEFCKKITYRTMGEKPEDLIASFRNSYNPRIAVTVDMISTGTDIKPLECLIFMRDVKSRVYFEQMKGRGTRIINPTDLQLVTSDARNKTHFVIIDAVGVCETDKTDSMPLERARNVPLEKLLMGMALRKKNKDMISSLAGRLSKIDLEMNEKEKQEIQKIAGKNMNEIVNELLDAVDPDKTIETACKMFDTTEPTKEQLNKASEELLDKASKPFDNPKLRSKIIEIKKKNEQIIDNISKDEVLFAGFDDLAAEKARIIVNNFKNFIEENKDELTALQIIYSNPYPTRFLTYDAIKELAEAIEKPPYYLTTDKLWAAYEKLEKSKVRGAGPHKLLTDIVSLLKFELGEIQVLEPFSYTVDKRFEEWISSKKKQGVTFTSEQLEWLKMIKDHIATSMSINKDDLEQTPFHNKGGLVKANKIFNGKIDKVMEELQEALVSK